MQPSLKVVPPHPLASVIHRQLAAAALPAMPPEGLTVGVEHEFFLFGPGDSPCSWESSQAFLAELRAAGWLPDSLATDDTSDDTSFGVQAVRDPSGRCGTIKYEHRPHLIEFASVPFSNALALDEALQSALTAIDQAALDSGVTVAHTPHAPYPSTHPGINRDDVDQQSLRHYRRRLDGAARLSEEWVNFSAVIAATQVQVGGLAWWERESLVEALYQWEPWLLAYAYAHVESPLPTCDLAARRWEGYSRVFEGYPLVGFPDMPGWTCDDWVESLWQMPLLGAPEEPWAGRRAHEAFEEEQLTPEALFALVRDLQIVKPRRSGTVEFRADPSQSSAWAISGMVALRLGLCAALVEGDKRVPNKSFILARKQWWDAVATGSFPQSSDPLETARAGLLRRGYGEERLLEMFGKP